MKPNDFLHQIDDRRLQAAIQAAELRTSGEIRIYISRTALGKRDVFAQATRRFHALKMTATRERNAVLIYMNPLSQKFAIIGDQGIHEKCGPAFWESIAAAMTADLAAGRITEALVGAVEKTAAVLREHFPRRADDQNELPDTIAGDEKEV